MITPLYQITYKYKNKILHVFLKDESKQLTGSIKYRPAKYMIAKAYENKEINKNTKIIEVTSGNMGIALSYVAKEFNNPITIFMPKDMSKERIDMIKKLGANLVLTKDFDEAFRLAESSKGYYVRQFENKYNAESYKYLVEELEDKLSDFPCFVSGVGTSGTLTGVGSILKKKYNTRIITLEPKESLIFSTGINHGEHEIQGLSDGFIPSLYNKEIVDSVIPISSIDSIKMAQKLMDKFHFSIGISSGTNFLGAVLSEVDNCITVFPDSSDRYYSTRLFDKNLKSELVDEIDLIDLKVIS